jgi:hypothetical protein
MKRRSSTARLKCARSLRLTGWSMGTALQVTSPLSWIRPKLTKPSLRSMTSESSWLHLSGVPRSSGTLVRSTRIWRAPSIDCASLAAARPVRRRRFCSDSWIACSRSRTPDSTVITAIGVMASATSSIRRLRRPFRLPASPGNLIAHSARCGRMRRGRTKRPAQLPGRSDREFSSGRSGEKCMGHQHAPDNRNCFPIVLNSAQPWWRNPPRLCRKPVRLDETPR